MQYLMLASYQVQQSAERLRSSGKQKRKKRKRKKDKKKKKRTNKLMSDSREVIVNVTRIALSGISLLETLASHGLNGRALSRANA